MMGLPSKHENDSFSWSVTDEIAAVRFRQALAEFATDLGKKEMLFSFLDKVEDSPRVKALLLLNLPGSLSNEPYVEFVKGVAGRSSPVARNPGQSGNDRRGRLSREENALNQFISRAARFKKVLVSCLRGAVAAPYLGASLASDIRFAAEDVTFALSSVRLGIPPGGGLGFFLPRYVGLGRASELLLSGNTLPVSKALELGLVQVILPKENYEARCAESARRFLKMPPAAIQYTRRLIHPYVEELDRFLVKEYEVMQQVLKPAGSWSVHQ